MRGFAQSRPENFPAKGGERFICTGPYKSVHARMFAEAVGRKRPHLTVTVVHSFNIHLVIPDPSKVVFIIASDTLDPPQFCRDHRKTITHVLSTDIGPRMCHVACIKTGKVRAYVMAWGNSDDVAQQMAMYSQ